MNSTVKILGLIVEYNPFHNGHLYHLEQSKKLSGADYVVCIMSGNFIQRGEPAIVNKWARAKMALLSGADLVIELPVIYAMSSAEYFAYGAVRILDSLGITDYICFGSESGKIEELDKIAELLCNEPESYRKLLKSFLSQGLSYPASRSRAISEYFNQIGSSSHTFTSIMSASNNILGIEYLKALKRIKSSVTPLTIERIANSYNSENMTGCISSATAIRKNISSKITHSWNSTTDFNTALPNTTSTILNEEFQSGRGPIFAESYENIILATLRKMTKNQIKYLPYVSEGLEGRIKSASENSGTYKELLENISTKRYATTRIQRTLFSSLLGITSDEFEEFNKYGGPQYIRVLGFNQNGRFLLSQINRKSSLPVIVKTADFKNSCNPLLKRMLEIESLATDLYVLAYNNPKFKKAGQEFTQNVVILK